MKKKSEDTCHKTLSPIILSREKIQHPTLYRSAGSGNNQRGLAFLIYEPFMSARPVQFTFSCLLCFMKVKM